MKFEEKGVEFDRLSTTKRRLLNDHLFFNLLGQKLQHFLKKSFFFFSNFGLLKL